MAMHQRRAHWASALILVTSLVLVNSPVTSASRFDRTTITPQQTHHLYIVGDSLTYAASHFGKLPSRISRTQRWSSVTLNSKFGRSITQGIKIVKKTKLREATAIVVGLGTNDMLSRREKWYPASVIDEFMSLVGDRPVLWFTIEFSTTRPDWRSRGVRFNRELKKATTRWPQLTVADWSKHFTPSGKSRFVTDGVHLTVSGSKTQANFIMAQLKLWSQQLIAQFPTTTTTIPESSTTSLPQ